MHLIASGPTKGFFQAQQIITRLALRAAQTTSSTVRGVGLKCKDTDLGREGWKISPQLVGAGECHPTQVTPRHQPSAALLPSHPLEDPPSSQECQGEVMADCWHSPGIASAMHNALWQGHGSQPGWGFINPEFPNTAFSETIMCINSSGVAKVCCKSNPAEG